MAHKRSAPRTAKPGLTDLARADFCSPAICIDGPTDLSPRVRYEAEAGLRFWAPLAPAAV